MAALFDKLKLRIGEFLGESLAICGGADIVVLSGQHQRRARDLRDVGGIRRRHSPATGRGNVPALPQQKLADEADNFELILVAVRREPAFDYGVGDRLDAFGAPFGDAAAPGLTAPPRWRRVGS